MDFGYIDRTKAKGRFPVKLITAIIKHTKLDSVRKVLTGLGVQGMTLTEVKGFGRQKGFTEVYRGVEYEVRFLPKVKIEIAVPDERVPEIVKAIEESAKSGEIGDGKIFVTGLLDAMRIRTGEKGEEAL
jgi:nitrogen regulatory protein P-II 2